MEVSCGSKRSNRKKYSATGGEWLKLKKKIIKYKGVEC